MFRESLKCLIRKPMLFAMEEDYVKIIVDLCLGVLRVYCYFNQR
jgi:hypothetical protein